MVKNDAMNNLIRFNTLYIILYVLIERMKKKINIRQNYHHKHLVSISRIILLNNLKEIRKKILILEQKESLQEKIISYL